MRSLTVNEIYAVSGAALDSNSALSDGVMGASIAGGIAGADIGIRIGAAAGTAVGGPVGTVVGGVAGGAIGAATGAFAVGHAFEIAHDSSPKK